MNQDKIVKFSSTLKTLFECATRIAAYPSTVLIQGETGVGKEVVANWIHKHSPRANMPFIKINAGAIPESLIESELFGYERGAFTGAKNEGNPGLFELADKGTLLLDEIGELSPSLQVKLLRVLQEQEIRRVGGSWSKAINVRVIASTNRDLRQLVLEGRFREDLYYRFNVAYLHVPPLHEHPGDILPLLDYYLERICQEFKITRKLTPETLQILLQHDYPGNVRELRNLVEGLCIMTDEEWITPETLPPHIRGQVSQQINPLSLHAHIEVTERKVIMEALKAEASIRQAAKRLEISHATLLRKMQKYGITQETREALH